MSVIRTPEQELPVSVPTGGGGRGRGGLFGLLVGALLLPAGAAHDYYSTRAEDSQHLAGAGRPNRGLIVDRNGTVLGATIRPTRWRDHPVADC